MGLQSGRQRHLTAMRAPTSSALPSWSVAAIACAACGLATPAGAAPFSYYMGGKANVVEAAKFHAAVQTPTPAVAANLRAVLYKTYGSGAQTLEVPHEQLTLVRVPPQSGGTPLAAVLRQAGLATRLAFCGHFADGAEAWPTVVMSEVRVRFKSAAIARRELARLAADGVGVRWQRGKEHDYLLVTKSAEAALRVAATLFESGAATFAYPDLLYRHVRRLTPNDTYFGEEWHARQIGAEGAWSISSGSTSVVIAILDDGTDLQHADLLLNLVGGYDVVGDGLNTDNDPSPTGDDAHGTATAGLAAAVGNNSRGVSGICPTCKIMPIRIMGGNGYNRASTDEDGFNWARTHGARVLSNSWGPAAPIDANYFADGLKAEIHNAVAENRVVIFAAGNEGAALTCPGGVPWEPAAYNEVISVGATDAYDSRMDYSNYGNTGCPLTLVAPAASFATDITGPRGYNSYSFGNDYTDAFGGTSASAPVTAGAVGLLLSIEATSPLTWGQVLNVLKISSDKIGGVTYDGSGYQRYYGYGRLNLNRAAGFVHSGSLCQPDAGGETFGTPACADSRDNDCDALVDLADPSCAPSDVAIGVSCAQGCGSQGKFCVDSFPGGGYCVATCTGGTTCETGAACWICACNTGPGTQADCTCDPDGCGCNTTAECDADQSGQSACECDPDCNLCMDVCLQDNECRASYICDYLFAATVKVCIPGCQSGFFDCAPDTCNTATGRCEHNGPTAPGGACTTDQGCAANGWCIGSEAQPDAGWPGGYCSPECAAAGSCPATSACVHFTDINLCLATCAAKSDCRGGYGCWPGFVAGARVCFPGCTASDCQAGEVCCSATGACEAPADCPAEPCACNATPQCDAGCGCDTDCCTCNTTSQCDAGCTCDPDCCTCDTGAGCQTDCTCDPDCGTACACDTGAGCQVGCGCDAACAYPCSCDSGAGCQAGCACDTGCAASCACDVDVTCDQSCSCDAECPCACDTSYSCDGDCACDPECYEKGCGCAAGEPLDMVLLNAGALGILALRRRRRR